MGSKNGDLDFAYFYPDSQQQLFTDREQHLGQLKLAQESLLAGRPLHFAFLGPRRIGKTLLIKEFIRRTLGRREQLAVPIFIDCQRAPLTPESFCTHYTGAVLFWLLRRGRGRASEFNEIGLQLKEAASLDAQLADAFYSLDRALKTAPVDQRALLDLAFEMPEVIARRIGRPLMIFLDEFPDLLALSNFREVGNVIDLLRSVLQTQQRVAYVAAGSAIGMMQAIFYDPASPLAVHFRTETLPPFTRGDSFALIEKQLGEVVGAVAEGIKLSIHRLAFGHPFYIGAICERLTELVRLQDAPLNAQSVQQAFVLEALWQNGRIANLCRYMLEKALEQVRGQSLPRLILQVLAGEEGGMTLTGLARRIKRGTAQARSQLSRLMEVDLIVQKGAIYDFRDPVMKLWAAYYYQGLELPAVPRQKILDQLVSEASQRYQRISSELGLARESQIRELMAAFHGQKVPGNLFGAPKAVQLPTFRKVEALQVPNAGPEIDAVAQGDQLWVAELKWRNQPARRSDLEEFLSKIRAAETTLLASPDVLWMVSRSGFREGALRFARQKGILVSTGQDLQALADLLGVRFSK